MTLATPPDEVRAEILRRIKDPTDLPKFERFYGLMDKRLTKLGQGGDAFAILDVTKKCWRRAFGVEWPRTKVD